MLYFKHYDHSSNRSSQMIGFKKIIVIFFLSIVGNVISIPNGEWLNTYDVGNVISTPNDEWLNTYDNPGLTCTGIERYPWQECGIGFNMNSLINSWLYSLIVGKNKDFSVIFPDGTFNNLKCYEESDGMATSGWECLFNDIPNLCKFNSIQDWTDNLIHNNVSESLRERANGIKMRDIRRDRSSFENNLGEIDYLFALSVLLKNIWNHMTPWMRKDLDKDYDNTLFMESKYLGLHIRRGDKVKSGEAKAVEVEDYFKAALEYLGDKSNEIKGIWVASDDVNILEEVRDISEFYFPLIYREDIVYNSGDKRVVTHSTWQDYSSFVTLMYDWEKLTSSELFVGTFSSNFGRLVAIFREAEGKPRSSSISVDIKKWFPL